MAQKRHRSLMEENGDDDSGTNLDRKILSSDIGDLIQEPTNPRIRPYHSSVCGSILHSVASNVSADVFAYLRHGNFDGFRRSIEIYHQDIVRMRNDRGQTPLHVLVICAYPFVWVRLMLMRSCDPCAQDDDGYTAAHYAVERDDVEMLKALTTRFYTSAKPITEQQIETVHESCRKALSIREKQGLTVFMLAYFRESLKCVAYLNELGINDCHLQDQFGDTSLHYAVARRNKLLVEKLINECKADVNGGNSSRPSALDVLQFNRQQQKPFDRVKDDEIEQILLSHKARNRRIIRRMNTKPPVNGLPEQSVAPNMASLSLDSQTDEKLETSRSYARLAATLKEKFDFKGAQENYEQALQHATDGTLDWATYATELGFIVQLQDQTRATELFQKALQIHQNFDETSEHISRLKLAISNLQHQATF